MRTASTQSYMQVDQSIYTNLIAGSGTQALTQSKSFQFLALNIRYSFTDQQYWRQSLQGSRKGLVTAVSYRHFVIKLMYSARSLLMLPSTSTNIDSFGNFSSTIRIGDSKGRSRLMRLKILKTQMYLILTPFRNTSSQGTYPLQQILQSYSLADSLIIQLQMAIRMCLWMYESLVSADSSNTLMLDDFFLLSSANDLSFFLVIRSVMSYEESLDIESKSMRIFSLAMTDFRFSICEIRTSMSDSSLCSTLCFSQYLSRFPKLSVRAESSKRECLARADQMGSSFRKFLNSDFIQIIINGVYLCPLYSIFCNISSMSQTIKVVVRVRPMNQKEFDRGCRNVLLPDPANNQISIQKPDDKQNIKSFGFDSVFNDESAQSLIYEKTAFKLVENVLEGYNGTIFAYGQTGCGKTHSMVGKPDTEELRGIIPRTFTHILGVVGQATNKEFLIRCSFIEIYNEEVHDLLSKDVKAKLDVKQTPEKGVFIKDLSMNTAKTFEDMMEYMNIGNKNRSVGETLMNKDSSRSHSIFTIFVQVAEKCQNGNDRYVAGKLNLVDLAGSERISKTGAAGERLKQAQKINLSLSALGNVISALVDGKSQHIPYRDSKLTRLLQDSLGGNTKTVMIANCSPADYNYDETLSTLRYAARAKFIKNKPVINEDPKDALLKEYAEQIKQLKLMLEGGGNIKSLSESGSSDMKQKLSEKQEELNNQKNERKKLQQRIREMENQQVKAGAVKIEQRFLSQMHKVRQQINNQKPKLESKGEEDVEPSKNMNQSEQLERYKKLCKKHKSKIKQLQSQIRDINKQHYNEKELLLDQIREETKENSLLNAILSMMLSKEEIEIIKSTAIYLDDKQEYKITPFHLKNKKVVFPKLPQNASKEMIRDEMENRELTFQNKSNTSLQVYNKPVKNNSQSSVRSLDRPQDQNLNLNNIIKNARTYQPCEGQPQRCPKKSPKKDRLVMGNVLEPIKNARPPLPQASVSPLKMVRKGQLQPLQ